MCNINVYLKIYMFLYIFYIFIYKKKKTVFRVRKQVRPDVTTTVWSDVGA